MATSIGQYAPVFLLGELSSLTDKPGRPQPTGSQRVGHDQSDSVRIDARLLLPVAAPPQWELSMKVAQLLGLQGPWWHQVCRDTDCLCHRSYSPIRVFFQASYSWQPEGLLGPSFSVAPLVRALRGLPCLGSFSVVRRVRHIEGPPSFSASGVWWVGLSTVQLRMLACCGREAMAMAPPSAWLSRIAVLPWLPGFPPLAFLTTISSLTSPQSISPQLTGVLTLGLLHNP